MARIKKATGDSCYGLSFSHPFKIKVNILSRGEYGYTPLILEEMVKLYLFCSIYLSADIAAVEPSPQGKWEEPTPVSLKKRRAPKRHTDRTSGRRHDEEGGEAVKRIKLTKWRKRDIEERQARLDAAFDLVQFRVADSATGHA